ncbi:MAG TPA: PAS domain-containing protein [Actinomycetota bacterium]|nr:PAS domain-containing protein [Actinomycetota bacterium]
MTGSSGAAAEEVAEEAAGAPVEEGVLRAVALTAQRFLGPEDWRAVVPEVLEGLGRAAGASRAAAVAVTREGDEVRNEAAGTWPAGPEDGLGPPDPTPRWAEVLSGGGVIHGPVSALPDPERRRLEARGVGTVLAVPVFAGQAWWGFLELWRRAERPWRPGEVDAVRTAADLLGAAIHRGRMDERLRRTEDRYRDLVERIPAITYQELVEVPDDRTASIVYVSPQVERILGYTQEEWSRPGFWQGIVHPEDRERVLEESDRTTATGRPYVQDYRMVARDGRVVWVHDEAVVLGRDEEGRALWQGVMIDVTPLKRAEERLQEAEERFRTLVEQNPAVIYTQVIDPEDPSRSKTVYISPGSEHLTGYTVAETLANPHLWRDILHPEDRERVLAADAETNRSGEAFDMEYRMIARDGRVVWVHDRATLVRDALGHPRFWQGFLLDVSERKEAEEALQRALDAEREAMRRMREVDELKDTFLRAVSHDLRTPLAAIMGLGLTLAREDVRLDPAEARELAARIAENAAKLDRLVSDLLDLDRLSRGAVEPTLVPTDVGGLVRRVVAGCDLLAGRPLEVEAEAVTVPADPSKVERIVENLLTNAARHTPPGTPVWVRVTATGEGALVEVADAGPGVPEALRGSIFEAFRRAPGADGTPGVGVGLALVARFAELHGGRAWVEERPGGGASFRVSLPGA